MKEFRQITFAAAGRADLMSDQVTTGFPSELATAPSDGLYQIYIQSTTVNDEFRVQCAGMDEVALSPIPGGGTAGQFPQPSQNTPIEFQCLAGDKVSIPVEAAGAGSVMATVEFAAL